MGNVLGNQSETGKSGSLLEGKVNWWNQSESEKKYVDVSEKTEVKMRVILDGENIINIQYLKEIRNIIIAFKRKLWKPTFEYLLEQDDRLIGIHGKMVYTNIYGLGFIFCMKEWRMRIMIEIKKSLFLLLLGKII